MTITVGTFEAKTKLSELLDRVEQGEEVVITRHGKEIARLVASQPMRSGEKKGLQDRLMAIGLKSRKIIEEQGLKVSSDHDDLYDENGL
jgi:prevent-host-death family protein